MRVLGVISGRLHMQVMVFNAETGDLPLAHRYILAIDGDKKERQKKNASGSTEVHCVYFLLVTSHLSPISEACWWVICLNSFLYHPICIYK
jgi:hypothetical protein